MPGIVLLEGGLPLLTKDGQHIGSIGISGATPELDGICAQAGIDAVLDMLSKKEFQMILLYTHGT